MANQLDAQALIDEALKAADGSDGQQATQSAQYKPATAVSGSIDAEAIINQALAAASGSSVDAAKNASDAKPDYMTQVLEKNEEDLTLVDQAALESILDPEEIKKIPQHVRLTEEQKRALWEHERDSDVVTLDNIEKMGAGFVEFLWSATKGGLKIANSLIRSQYVDELDTDEDVKQKTDDAFGAVSSLVAPIVSTPMELSETISKMKSGGNALKDFAYEKLGIQTPEESFQNFSKRKDAEQAFAGWKKKVPSVYGRAFDAYGLSDQLSALAASSDSRTDVDWQKKKDDARQAIDEYFSQVPAEDTDIYTLGTLVMPEGSGMGTFGATMLAGRAIGQGTNALRSGIGALGRSEAATEAIKRAGASAAAKRFEAAVAEAEKAGETLTSVEMDAVKAQIEGEFSLKGWTPLEASAEEVEAVASLGTFGRSAEDVNAIQNAREAVSRSKFAAKTKARFETPGAVERAATAVDERILAAAEKVKAVAEKTPEILKTLAPYATGGAVGATVTEGDPLAAVAGAVGIKGLLKAPAGIAQIAKARRLSTGGPRGTFETLGKTYEGSQKFQNLFSQSGKAFDRALDNLADITAEGANAGLYAIAAGALDSSSPEEVFDLIGQGFLFAAKGKVLNKAKAIVTGSPNLTLRDIKKGRIESAKAYNDASPATRDNIDVISAWDNSIEREKSRLNTFNLAAETAEAAGKTESADQLRKQAAKSEKIIESLQRADSATRDYFQRDFIRQFGEMHSLVNGSMRSGQNNVRIEILSPEEIASVLTAGVGPSAITAIEAQDIANTARQRGFYAEAGKFDKSRPSVVINANALYNRMMLTGESMSSALWHEVGHHLDAVPEFREQMNSASEKLFGTRVTDVSGNVIEEKPGILTEADLLKVFEDDYLSGRYFKDSPEAEAEFKQRLKEFSQNAGLWDNTADVLDESKAIEYVKKEILADLAGTALSSGILSQDSSIKRAMDLARVQAKMGILDNIRATLGSIWEGIKFVDEPKKFTSVTGVKFTPEVEAAARNALRAVREMDGLLAREAESDEGPKISRVELMRNKALRDRYGKDSGMFKTVLEAQVYDADGKPVGKPIEVSGADAMEGSWRNSSGVEVAAEKTSQTEGFGALPGAIRTAPVPAGGRLVVTSRIATEADGVTPILLTAKESKQILRSRKEAINAAFDTPDQGTPGRFEPVREGSETYRGAFTPLQVQAIKNIPESILPRSMKARMLEINDVVKRNDGSRILIDYAAMMNDNGKYRAFGPKVYDLVPIGMHLSKDGNFLVTTISVGRLHSKLNLWAERMPDRLSLWNGNKEAFFSDFINKYLMNWQYREQRPDGSEIYPNGRPGEFGLDPNPQIALEKKGIFNDFLNLTNASTPEEAPRTSIPRKQGDPRGKDLNRTIMSVRIDHVTDLAENTSGEKIPINYGNAIRHFAPDLAAYEMQERSLRFAPSRIGEKGFYSKVEDTLDKKMPRIASEQQVLAIVDPTKGSGIKPDELKWRNFDQIVKDIASENGGRVPKDALIKKLNEDQGIEFVEKELRPESGFKIYDTVYDITLGEFKSRAAAEEALSDVIDDQVNNYPDFAEIEESSDGRFYLNHIGTGEPIESQKNDSGFTFWTQPEKGYATEAEAVDVYADITNELVVQSLDIRVIPSNESSYIDYKLPGGDDTYKEVVIMSPEVKYTSNHFRELGEGYIGHYRSTERSDGIDFYERDLNGLLIEEIQSDLHQERRREGDARSPDTSEWTVQYHGDLNNGLKSYSVRSSNGLSLGYVYEKSESDAIGKVAKMHTIGVADAPFKKDWPLQIFKRALRDAVEGGKSWIGWTDGKTQSDLYDLSNAVDRIHYSVINEGEYGVSATRGGVEVFSKEMPASEVEKTFGKEILEKIKNQKGTRKETEDGEEFRTLSGLDLKVGGKGMVEFYDKILPNEIGKYVKQWGARVEQSTLADGKGDKHQIWKINIPESMRADIGKRGQARFAPEASRAEKNEEALRQFKTRFPGSQAVFSREGRLSSPDVRRMLRDEQRSPGTIDRDALQEMIDRDIPVEEVDVDEMIANLPSDEVILDALESTAKGKGEGKVGNLDLIPAGEKITTRQDIPSWREKQVGVVSVAWKGEDGKQQTTYVPFFVIDNPRMIPSEAQQRYALKIGAGGSKEPTITISGEKADVQELPADLADWTQVGFNPDRHSYYYDRADGSTPIIGGSMAVQVGNTVFVRDAVRGEKRQFRFSPDFVPEETQESQNTSRRLYGSEIDIIANTGMMYHGGGWNGVTAPLIRDGALGTGVYFTSDKSRAVSYANGENQTLSGLKKTKKHIVSAEARLSNPLVIDSPNDWMAASDSLVKLGMSREKANDKVDSMYEKKGNIGSVIRTKGIQNGHDGIIWNRGGDSEIVVWYPNNIRVIDAKSLDEQVTKPDASVRFSPEREGEERIVKAVYRNPKTWEVSEGATHREANPAAPEEATDREGPNYAFRTSTGRIVSRREAFDVAQKAGQIFGDLTPEQQDNFDRKVLHSGMFQPGVMRGINVNSAESPFAQQIVSGEKTIETRDSRSLDPYIGQRVGIIATGVKPVQILGSAVVGEPKEYASEAEFRADQGMHLVQPGSEFDIKPGRTKFGYPMEDVRPIEPIDAPKGGIVARNLEGLRFSPEEEKKVTFAFTTSSDRVKLVSELAKAGDWQGIKDLNQATIRHAMSDIPGVRYEIRDVLGAFENEREVSASVQFSVKDANELAEIRKRMVGIAELWKQTEILEEEVGAGDQNQLGKIDENNFMHVKRAELTFDELTAENLELARKEAGIQALTADGNKVVFYDTENNESKFSKSIERFTDSISRNGGVPTVASVEVAKIRSYRDPQSKKEGSLYYNDDPVLLYGSGQSGDRLKSRVYQVISSLLGRPIPPPKGGRSAYFVSSDVTPDQVRLQNAIGNKMDRIILNDRNNPDAIKAYEELNKDLISQYDALIEGGMTFRAAKDFDSYNKEYPNSNAVIRDIRNNSNLYYLQTNPETFGPLKYGKPLDFSFHPLLKDSGRVDADGNKMTYNDVLRVVHDAIAHGIYSSSFGPVGEESAWHTHIRTIDNPWSRWALTSETRGQNSWVNYRDARLGPDGMPLKPGDPGYAPIKDREFSEQKFVLLPLEYSLTGDPIVDAPVRMLMDEIGADRAQGSPESGSPSEQLRFAPIEVEKGDDASMPIYQETKKGVPAVDRLGKPKYVKEEYNLLSSPFIEKYSGPSAEDTTKPDYKSLAYDVTKPAQKKINNAIDSGSVDAAANIMAERARVAMENESIAAGAGWYSRMREKLLNALGPVGRELLSQLLGATSAKTPVNENFLQSMDAFEGINEGRYDSNRRFYLEMLSAEDGGSLNDLIKERGYVDLLNSRISQHRKDARKLSGKKKDAVLAEAAKLKKLTSINPEDRTRKDRFSIFINASGLMPMRSNGKKFNANSMAVMKVIAGTWLDNRKAPKTPNFAGNLSGRTVQATIDVWAARFIRQILHEGFGVPWRIQPKSESAVNNEDFALGQVIMQRAAKKLGMNPDDLQAILWFAEKHNWEKNGWTGKEGAEKSSFDEIFDVFFPQGGNPLTFAEASEIFKSRKKEEASDETEDDTAEDDV